MLCIFADISLFGNYIANYYAQSCSEFRLPFENWDWIPLPSSSFLRASCLAKQPMQLVQVASWGCVWRWRLPFLSAPFLCTATSASQCLYPPGMKLAHSHLESTALTWGQSHPASESLCPHAMLGETRQAEVLPR